MSSFGEALQGNPVGAGNCPATVKGTKAARPLSAFGGREGRRVGVIALSQETLDASKTRPFEGRGGFMSEKRLETHKQ
jgi:hypothetical protein